MIGRVLDSPITNLVIKIGLLVWMLGTIIVAHGDLVSKYGEADGNIMTLLLTILLIQVIK